MIHRPPTTAKSFVSRILHISPLSDVVCGQFPVVGRQPTSELPPNMMIPIERQISKSFVSRILPPKSFRRRILQGVSC